MIETTVDDRDHSRMSQKPATSTRKSVVDPAYARYTGQTVSVYANDIDNKAGLTNVTKPFDIKKNNLSSSFSSSSSSSSTQDDGEGED